MDRVRVRLAFGLSLLAISLVSAAGADPLPPLEGENGGRVGCTVERPIQSRGSANFDFRTLVNHLGDSEIVVCSQKGSMPSKKVIAESARTIVSNSGMKVVCPTDKPIPHLVVNKSDVVLVGSPSHPIALFACSSRGEVPPQNN